MKFETRVRPKVAADYRLSEVRTCTTMGRMRSDCVIHSDDERDGRGGSTDYKGFG